MATDVEPQARGRSSTEEAEERGVRRRAALVVLLVSLGTLLALALYFWPEGDDVDHSLDGAPFVTNFVVGWRDSDQASVYTVDAVDPQGDELTYTWDVRVGDCGTLVAEGPEAVWTHPKGADPDCRPTSESPDGGMSGQIAVVISDGTFDCRVVYRKGSTMGTMAYPATCVRKA